MIEGAKKGYVCLFTYIPCFDTLIAKTPKKEVVYDMIKVMKL